MSLISIKEKHFKKKQHTPLDFVYRRNHLERHSPIKRLFYKKSTKFVGIKNDPWQATCLLHGIEKKTKREWEKLRYKDEKGPKIKTDIILGNSTKRLLVLL